MLAARLSFFGTMGAKRGWGTTRRKDSALIVLLGLYVVAAAAPAACPAHTLATEVPWSPLPWRNPLMMCVCPEGHHCRGPYCELSKTHHRAAFVAGCSSCRCVPSCVAEHQCQLPNCACAAHIAEVDQRLLRDPRTPHDLTTVQAALEEAFPHGLPGPFEPGYKNPCWKEHGRLRCIPYAYIAGFLKCATTALFDTLMKHADVQTSWKETHWWTRGRRPFTPGGPSLSEKFSAEAQAIQDAARPHEAVFFDGSVSMIWETNYGGVLTPELVHRVQPDAKFILMVRDPADRLFSDFIYFAYRTRFDRTADKALYSYDAEGFHHAVVQSLEIMRQCLSQHSSLVCATAQRQYRSKTQIQLGMYSEFLELWHAFFPKNQFLVLRQEDIKRDPGAVYRRVTQHLGLTALPASIISGSDNKPNSLKYHSSMLPETRALLNHFYAPYNEKLAAMESNPDYNYHLPQQSGIP